MQWWYELDEGDRLIAVSPDWDTFAHENDAPENVASAVLGRPLWEFIAGAETEDLLRRIINVVRTRSRAVDVPFRCDSPGILRHMRFHAAPAGNNGVRITTHLLRELAADGMHAELRRPRASWMVAMCSWCNAIRLDDGAWVEVDDGVARLRLFDTAHAPAVTHTICDTCLESIYPHLGGGADPDGPARPPR